MGCFKLSYHLSAEPRLRCVYNAAYEEENRVAYSISNTDGSVAKRYSYDAWGRLRDSSTHVPFAHNAQPKLLLNRGYTGHEHLPEFGLINMNARLYDPVIGRFISPDPYVQAPLFTQSYNRYSYCLNNPLSYTDISGEDWYSYTENIYKNGNSIIFNKFCRILIGSDAQIANIFNQIVYSMRNSNTFCITFKIVVKSIKCLFAKGFTLTKEMPYQLLLFGIYT